MGHSRVYTTGKYYDLGKKVELDVPDDFKCPMDPKFGEPLLVKRKAEADIASEMRVFAKYLGNFSDRLTNVEEEIKTMKKD